MTISSASLSNSSLGLTDGRADAIVDFQNPLDYVDIGHSELAYWKVGQGPDLVLVHGWPIHSATYRRMLPFLVNHFTCHLFDFPGAGLTKTGESSQFGLRAHADSLLAAIKKKGIKRYALLGYDSGGAIMQLVAAKDADNIVGMVLGNTETPGYHTLMMKMLLLVGRFPRLSQVYLQSLRFKWFRHSDFGLGGCFKDKSLIEGEFHDLFLKPIFASQPVRYYIIKMLQNVNEQDLKTLIKAQESNQIPTLLQWGSDDVFFLLEDAKKMMQRFKGPKEIHVYEGGKLFVHEEYPEEFAQRSIDFLHDRF